MPFDLFPAETSPAVQALSRMGVECVVCDDEGAPKQRRFFRLSLLLSKFGIA